MTMEGVDKNIKDALQYKDAVEQELHELHEKGPSDGETLEQHHAAVHSKHLQLVMAIMHLSMQFNERVHLMLYIQKRKYEEAAGGNQDIQDLDLYNQEAYDILETACEELRGAMHGEASAAQDEEEESTDASSSEDEKEDSPMSEASDVVE
jgi:hypothetical protein